MSTKVPHSFGEVGCNPYFNCVDWELKALINMIIATEMQITDSDCVVST